MKYHSCFLAVVMMLLSSVVYAHPTGNMITVGEHVLWSYINPIDDPDHHACVMNWSKTSDPKVFLQSRHPTSDFMLYNNNDDIYIIERRHVPATKGFEIRIVKTTVRGESKVIWDWFADRWRIGEGGFIMNSDDEIIFCRYPDLLRMKKGEKPETYFEINHPVKRMRAVENNLILLMDDQACFLATKDGTIVRQWYRLIDNDVTDAPLNRNQIFNADYKNGELLLAYWGNRSFELINSSGTHHAFGKPFFESLTAARKSLLECDVLIKENLNIPGETAEDIINRRTFMTQWKKYLNKKDLTFIQTLFASSPTDFRKMTPTEMYVFLNRHFKQLKSCKMNKKHRINNQLEYNPFPIPGAGHRPPTPAIAQVHYP